MARYFNKKEIDSDIEKVKGPQAWALCFLYENQDRPVYMKDLQEYLSMRKSTVSKLVERMVNNNFITIELSEQDKRFKQILMTSKAKDNMHQIDKMTECLENTLVKNITKTEQEDFLKILDKIKQNIQ